MRPPRGSIRAPGSDNQHWPWVGALFVIGAAAMAGLPPLPGFIGKAVILAGAGLPPWSAWTAWVYGSVLTAGALTLIAYALMGSRLFWKRDAARVHPHRLPAIGLAAALLVLTILAAPVQRYTDQAAAEMKRPGIMMDNVLGKLPRQAAKPGAAK